MELWFLIVTHVSCCRLRRSTMSLSQKTIPEIDQLLFLLFIYDAEENKEQIDDLLELNPYFIM